MSPQRTIASPHTRRSAETATVALRAQTDLPELPKMYSTGLLATYGPLIYLAMRLREGARLAVAPRTLRTQVGERVDRARESAINLGISKEDVRDAEFAVVALLDSVAQSQPGALRELWAGRTLENERFQTTTAGHVFFEILDRLLRRGNPDVLEFYHLALVAGFEGEKKDRPQDISVLTAEIQRQLGARRGPEALSPRTTVELPPAPPEREGPSPMVLLIVSLSFVFLVLCGLTVLMIDQGRELGQDARSLGMHLRAP